MAHGGMGVRREISIFANVPERRLQVSATDDSAPSTLIELDRGDQVLFKATCLQTVAGACTAWAFDAATTFALGVDRDYSSGVVDDAYSTTYSQSGDWDDEDVTAGLVSVRLGLDTANLSAALLDEKQAPFHLALWATEPGESPYLVLQAVVVVRNVGSDPGAEQVLADLPRVLHGAVSVGSGVGSHDVTGLGLSWTPTRAHGQLVSSDSSDAYIGVNDFGSLSTAGGTATFDADTSTANYTLHYWFWG